MFVTSTPAIIFVGIKQAFMTSSFYIYYKLNSGPIFDTIKTLINMFITCGGPVGNFTEVGPRLHLYFILGKYMVQMIGQQGPLK